MKRRGFLGLLAGAAVTPLAKALPARSSTFAIEEWLPASNAEPYFGLTYSVAEIEAILRELMIFGQAAVKLEWRELP